MPLLIFMALFSFSLYAEEENARDFFFCSLKTALAVESRTVSIHQFSTKNQCFIVYSLKGQNQIIFRSRWISSCEKKAQQVVDRLEKGSWNCQKSVQSVKIFYSS